MKVADRLWIALLFMAAIPDHLATHRVVALVAGLFVYAYANYRDAQRTETTTTYEKRRR